MIANVLLFLVVSFDLKKVCCLLFAVCLDIKQKFFRNDKRKFDS